MTNIIIKDIAETDMDPATDQEIRQALVTCFPKAAPRFARSRAWQDCTAAWTVLAYDGKRMAAGIAVVDRTVTADGQTFRAAGLGNVFVLPGFRGRGLSTRLLTACMDLAAREGFDCGLLFCGREVAHVYEKAGWRQLDDTRIRFRKTDGSTGSLDAGGTACAFPLRRALPDKGIIDLNGCSW